MNAATTAIYNELLVDYPGLRPIAEEILAGYETLHGCARAGGTILVCGNGGSAADADHIVGELVKGFRLPRPLPRERCDALAETLPSGFASIPGELQSGVRAISLTSHAALVTAIGNDVSFEMVYAQQVFVLGRPGDVLIGLSTSGNARNVASAVAVARAIGMRTIAMSGGKGGRIGGLADTAIVVPETETYRIQELHLPIYHALCAMVEAELFARQAPGDDAGAT